MHPMQGVHPVSVGHASHHQGCRACPVAPSWARAIMSKAQCFLVQAARSNPLSFLTGSSCHAWAQRIWVWVICLDSFSSLIGSGTLFKPNTRQEIFLGPHAGFSVFYTDPIPIILIIVQLKISQEWNYTLVSPLHKRIRFMAYKYTMNHSN
jgi:hypothetical protein